MGIEDFSKHQFTFLLEIKKQTIVFVIFSRLNHHLFFDIFLELFDWIHFIIYFINN